MFRIFKKIFIMILLVITIFAFDNNIYGADSPSQYSNIIQSLYQQWYVYNYYSTYYGVRLYDYNTSQYYVEIPKGIKYITITIPGSSYNLKSDSVGDSSIDFLNSSLGVEYSFDFTDIHTWNVINQINFDLVNKDTTLTFALLDSDDDGIYNELWVYWEGQPVDLNDHYGVDDLQIEYISATIQQNFTSIPSQYADYWNENGIVNLLQEGVRVNFYNHFQLINSYSLSNGPITFPDPPSAPEGYSFNGWNSITGDKVKQDWVNFSPFWITQDSEGYYNINLYATFKMDNLENPANDVSPPATQDWFTSLMTTLRLNSDSGYVFLFVMVSLILTFGILVLPFKLAKGGLLFIELIWLIFATYLGMIPIYITAILGVIELSLILMLLTQRESGGGDISDE